MRALLALLPIAALWPACDTPPAPTEFRERWLIVDQDADPLGLGDHPGAIFELDPASGSLRVFCATGLWRDPTDIVRLDDGTFLVADYHDADGPDGNKLGKLFRVAADGSSVAELALPPGLADPCSLARAPDGSVWIADKNAGPEKRGAVWRWRPGAPGELERIAGGAPMAAPAELRFQESEAFLLDADAYKSAGNGSVLEGAIFALQPGGKLTPIVRTRAISPLSMLIEPDGTFLVLDTNAETRDGREYQGMLRRTDPRSGASTTLCRATELCDPVRLVRHDNDLLVVDANADPHGYGHDGLPRGFGGHGPGAILRIDPATWSCEVVFASREFKTPTNLLVLPHEECRPR